MSVEATIGRTRYEGNGSAVEFPVGFSFAAAEDVRAVWRRNSPTVPGAMEDVELTLDVDFTLTGDGEAGEGVVRFAPGGAPLPAGEVLILLQGVPLTQERSWSNADAVDVREIEKADDKLTRICQQLDEKIGRCVKVSVTADSNPADYLGDAQSASGEARAAADAAREAQGGAEVAREGAEAARDELESMKRTSVPDGGTPGQFLKRGEGDIPEWDDIAQVPQNGEPGQVIIKKEEGYAWDSIEGAFLGGRAPGLRNQIIAGRVKDGYPAFLVRPEFLNMEHEDAVKHSKVGTVSASAVHSGPYNEVKPLRNQVVWQSNGWLTPDGQRAGWWQYDFAEGHVLAGLFMLPFDNLQGQCPKDWELLGWNGVGWDVIYSRTNDQGQRGYNSNEKSHGRMYWFTENTTPYRRVRLNVKDVIGDGLNRINIAALRFYEAVIPGQHKYDVSLYATHDTPFMASVACGYDAKKRPVDIPFCLTSPATIDGGTFAEMSRNHVYLVPAEKDGSLPANLDPAKATKIEGQGAYLYVDTRKIHYGSVADIERECVALLQSRHEVDYDPVPNCDFEHDMGAHGNPLHFDNVQVFTAEPHRGAPSSYHFANNSYIHTRTRLDQVFKDRNVHPYGQHFTLEIDFKFEGNAPESSDSYYVLFDGGYNSGKGWCSRYWNRRKVIGLYWNDKDYYHVPFDASDGLWHTLSVSKHGGNLFVHVDGKCLGAFCDVPEIKQYYRGWMVGRWWHTDGGRWVGYLNNMRYTVGTALYQGENYDVPPVFSTSLIPHRTLWYDAGECVVKEWDAFARAWTPTPMLPLGHVETGFKEHLLTDQPRGTHHLRHTKWVDPEGFSTSGQHDGNHTPACLFNFGHGGEYSYATPSNTAKNEDHYVQFTLDAPMSFERLVLCETTWDWRAWPAVFTLSGSNDGETWTVLVDRTKLPVDGGGAPHAPAKSNGNSHHVGFYKHFALAETEAFQYFRLDLPSKGEVPFYGDYAYTGVRMTLTFAGAKPEVEKVKSYAVGGLFTLGPVPIEVNQNYRFEMPFGGAPFTFAGYVEEEGDFQAKRRLLGQGHTYLDSAGKSWGGRGETVYVERDALVVQTHKSELSIYTGNVHNAASMNTSSTRANLYLVARRNW